MNKITEKVPIGCRTFHFVRSEGEFLICMYCKKRIFINKGEYTPEFFINKLQLAIKVN